jgi:hypothetical protein
MADKLLEHNAAVRLSPNDPQWVREMHDHFRRTGFYRPSDLKRVLGDPRESVEVRLKTDGADFIRPIKK